MYKVLLISSKNWDSLKEIPVVLKNAGCEVDIYAAKGSWVLANRFHDKWIEASIDENKFTDDLLTFLERHAHEYNWIIPGDDIIIRQLNDRITSDELFRKVMPVTKIENRALLGSKAGLSALCKQYNIKTPKYLIYDESQTVDSIADYMGFPIMVKEDESEGGYGVFRCDNINELKEIFNKIKNRNNLVFQQLIEGEDINTEALYKDNKLMVYNHSLRMKTIGTFGISTKRVFYQNEALDEILINIGDKLALNGFGNIVFIQDNKTKEYYLIEIDMRPNSWMYYGKFTGNDFTLAIKNIINNNLILLKPSKKLSNRKRVISIYKKDIYRCITTKDIGGLFYWLINRDDCWSYIPVYDRKLFKAVNKHLFNTIKEYIHAKTKKAVA